MNEYTTVPELTDPRLTRAARPVARAFDAASVTFERPDLQKAVRFLSDFGFARPRYQGDSVWLYPEAGYGPCVIVRKGKRERFVGPGLMMSSRDDLVALSALPGASAISPAEGWPEGEEITLVDPAGFLVRAVYGPKPNLPAVRERLVQNSHYEAVRLNAGQRPPVRPSTVLRMGHAVLGVVDFFRTARWYMDTFGLLPSDIQTIGEDDPALVFMRCDRGDEPADHHTIVIAQNVDNLYSHSAYEVIDLDDIAMGQQHLLGRGYQHSWGIGRHLLGSQIFDYWRDPWGMKFEHFCDSDKFTSDTPPGITPLTSGGLYQWGPQVPKDFEAPKLTPGLIWRTLNNIRKSDELTFARMANLKRAIDAPPRPKSKKAGRN
ncbi:glyoxalase [Sphingobium sp. SCG-1]|uniref:VOC family protein n=1 Tax=Sphingobium sp. SCG-1 TaxID=2072936 RepID=UPI000CD6A6A7|nr:VOC family protein [Sphingobium sp. SCG-1]AUW59304.1 glyoxalase [Sphingobium sp. SCG-1]